MVKKMLQKKSSGTRFVKVSMFQGMKIAPRKLTEKEKERIKKLVKSFSKLDKVERRQAMKQFKEKYPIKKRKRR